MIGPRDPAFLSSECRISELADVLALGYLRLLLRRKPLDLLPRAEAACGLSVNGNITGPRKETA